MKRQFGDFVADIKEASELILEFTQNVGYEDFIKDKKTQLAVCRCFEIIGEATKRIPDDIKNDFPDIAWQLMARFRDVLIHNYSGIDSRILWQTILTDIPQLYKKIVLVDKKMNS